jgi:hypothetical protein
MHKDILPVYGLLIFVSGIVISVKILGLKFVPYIADIAGFRLGILRQNRKHFLASIFQGQKHII